MYLVLRIQPLEGFAAPPFHYEQKSWGPDEANDFMARDGRRWHEPLTGK